MGNIFVIIAFVAYALVILGIGIFSYKKSKSMNDYFIGGRQLGSWTTAISAQASDMSGWLLMGLPGAIFVSGLTESWIAIGLFIGTYLNWKILAARLRKMSYAAGDAITIPEYFQKHFFKFFHFATSLSYSFIVKITIQNNNRIANGFNISLPRFLY